MRSPAASTASLTATALLLTPSVVAPQPMQDHYHRGGSGLPSTSEPGSAVFVSNLQWWTTDVELEGLASAYGSITSIRFIEDKACGKSRGMAVVEFAEPDAAARCIAGLNGRDINGRHCRVTHQNAGRGGGGGSGARGGPPPPSRGVAASGNSMGQRPGMQPQMVMMPPAAMMGELPNGDGRVVQEQLNCCCNGAG